MTAVGVATAMSLDNALVHRQLVQTCLPDTSNHPVVKVVVAAVSVASRGSSMLQLLMRSPVQRWQVSMVGSESAPQMS